MTHNGASTANTYRPDIDGLRAIAVAAVVLFHSGLSVIPGGYVGVDVFFVISGYLITQILRRDLEVGRIDIKRFYERRLRRILPALLVFFVIVLTAGCALLAPADLVELGKEMLASLAFVSNIKFWRGADYWFSGVRPLLHTWSLSIEEQFYLFFPLLLSLVAKRGLTITKVALYLTWVASLAISIIGLEVAPSATFFLLPSRIWELATGAILALDLVPRLHRTIYREAGAGFGLAMIIVPCITYTERTAFPGVAALLPCVGTALIIQAGRDGDNAVASVLRQPIIVALGLISYSLYLYHYPVIVFAKEVAGNEQLPAAWAISAVLVSLLLAILSWHFVEQPFRNGHLVGQRALFTGSALASAVVAIAAGGVIAASGLPQRLSPHERAIIAAEGDLDPRLQHCIRLPVQSVFSDSSCLLGRADKAATDFVVLGDSHAAILSSAIQPIAFQSQRSGVLMGFGSCPPLLGWPMIHLSSSARTECELRIQQQIRAIQENPKVTDVFLIAYWPAYAEEHETQTSKLLASALLRTVRALDGKNITLLYDLPVTQISLPRRLVLASRLGLPQPTLDLVGSAAFESALPELEQLRVRLISLAPPLCPERRNCPPMVKEHPVLVDSNHVSRSVAEVVLAPYLAQQALFGSRQK